MMWLLLVVFLLFDIIWFLLLARAVTRAVDKLIQRRVETLTGRIRDREDTP